MADDLEPLGTLYGRFAAIAQEMAHRDAIARHRASLSRLAAHRQSVGVTDQVPQAALSIDPSEARFDTLRAAITSRLRSVCPIMPAEAFERLVTRAASIELAAEMRETPPYAAPRVVRAGRPAAPPSRPTWLMLLPNDRGRLVAFEMPFRSVRKGSVALAPTLVPHPSANLEKRGPVLGRAEREQEDAGAPLDSISAVGNRS
jgi:hypothetical protein